MHNLDVDLEVWPRSHPARMYAVISPGANAVTRRWSIVTAVGRHRWELVPIQRSEAFRDDRPRARVGGRFAGEVSGVELGDGGVEVVELEHDECHDPFVSVDLDDAEEFVSNRLGVAARGFKMREDEAPTPGRNDASTSSS